MTRPRGLHTPSTGTPPAGGTANGTTTDDTTHRTTSPEHPRPDTTGAERKTDNPTGRQPAQERGRRRRQKLLSAAVHLLHEGGFVAVTHRAVARHARLPLAATTYYFSCREELLTEAFALLVTEELATLRAAATGTDPLGNLLTELTADRPRRLSLWELYLHAGRDPALQQVARDWTDGWNTILTQTLRTAGHDLPPADARLTAVLINGLWLEHLVEDRPESIQEGRTLLTRALTIMRSTPSQPL
ncbi:TetR family transcriptional regulator C-terminal domain-containing protein [Streptosporangium sp. NPDC051023]|uniref:TetR/AcrR family transcriptional regulator n=1 Tax=Streptosporangium sp. NPDC051023 TaxID=3155410 RepID=UPI00344FEEBA